MKARVQLDEDSGGQLIIRREGTRVAFVVPDFPPGSFSADAEQLADDETKHGDVAQRGVIKGTSSGPSTLVRFPSISASFPLITDSIEPGGWPTMASYGVEEYWSRIER